MRSTALRRAAVASAELRRAVASDSLAIYLNSLRRYPILSQEQEVVLARHAREGNRSAFEALVCSNLRFVVSIAKKYQNRGLGLADLINEGNCGLMRAAGKFDETRGIKFISYAVWWIRQAILQALTEQGKIVRIPAHSAVTMQRIGRRAAHLRQQLGREPTFDEVAAATEVDPAEVERTLAIVRRPLSLERAYGPENDGRLLDTLPDGAAATPDERVHNDARAASVRAALATLTPREAMVLALYFGLDGQEPLTLEEIGQRHGVTRERVRQIKQKALARLRHGRQARALASWRN